MSGDFVEDAKVEISGMAKGGMRHPSTRPVLAAAAAIYLIAVHVFGIRIELPEVQGLGL